MSANNLRNGLAVGIRHNSISLTRRIINNHRLESGNWSIRFC
jgi:hypothetical protein